MALLNPQRLDDGTRRDLAENFYFTYNERNSKVPMRFILYGGSCPPQDNYDYEDLWDQREEGGSMENQDGTLTNHGLHKTWKLNNAKKFFGTAWVAADDRATRSLPRPDDNDKIEGVYQNATPRETRKMNRSILENRTITHIMCTTEKEDETIVGRYFYVRMCPKKLKKFDPDRMFPDIHENNKFLAESNWVASMSRGFVQRIPEGKYVPIEKQFRIRLREACNGFIRMAVRQIGPYHWSRNMGMMYQLHVDQGYGKRHTKYSYDRFVIDSMQNEAAVHTHHITGLVGVGSGYSLYPGYGSSSKDTPKESAVSSNGQRQWQNVWYDQENDFKECLEGSVANLLVHMGSPEHAEDLMELTRASKYATADDLDGFLRLGESFPKSWSKNKPSTKDITFWFLRVRCGFIIHPLNRCKFSTRDNCITSLQSVSIPILGSIDITTRGTRPAHVMVFWQDRIIDVEQKTTQTLSIANIVKLCNADFRGFTEAHGLVPHELFRRRYDEYSNSQFEWGDCESLTFRNKHNRRTRQRRKKGKMKEHAGKAMQEG